MIVKRLLQRRLVKRLDDELVVYDQQNHKIFHLNEAAAVVWEHCEDARSVEELTRALAAETKCPEDEEIVRLAIQELRDAGLIEVSAGRLLDKRVSRRELMEKVAHLAIVLPAVVAMLSPTPAMAMSAPGGTLAPPPTPEPEPTSTPTTPVP